MFPLLTLSIFKCHCFSFLFGFLHLKNRYYICEINKCEVIFIFNNKRFISRGVQERIPPLLQIIMWELIKQMPVDKDYLQVFSLSIKDGRQRIKHCQEIPEYSREYFFDLGFSVTEKIFVIDDKTHSTMILANEY